MAVAANAVHGRQLENLEGHFKVERGQMLSYGRTPAFKCYFLRPLPQFVTWSSWNKEYNFTGKSIKKRENWSVYFSEWCLYQQALMLNPNQLHCFHIYLLASLNWLRGSFLDIESLMQEKRKNFHLPLIWPLSKTEWFCLCCNYANMCDSCWSINYLSHFQFICSESVDRVTPLCLFSKSSYTGWFF